MKKDHKDGITRMCLSFLGLGLILLFTSDVNKALTIAKPIIPCRLLFETSHPVAEDEKNSRCGEVDKNIAKFNLKLKMLVII